MLKERPVSTEERLISELKQKGTFKAQPLNKKIFEQQKLGIPYIEKMPTTEFQPFQLKTTGIKTKDIDYVPKEDREL